MSILDKLKEVYPNYANLLYEDKNGIPLFKLALALSTHPAPLAIKLAKDFNCGYNGGFLKP